MGEYHCNAKPSYPCLFDIDLDRVWDTVTDDLPPLIASLEKIILQDDKGP